MESIHPAGHVIVPKTGPAPKKNEFKSRRAEPQFDATALPARGVGGMHRTPSDKRRHPPPAGRGLHRFGARNFGSNSRYAVAQTTMRATISTGTQSVIFPSRLAIPEHDGRREGH